MNKTLLAMLISSAAFFSHASDWSLPDLGVGDKALKQSIQHHSLAQGVDLYEVIRGESSGEEYLLSSGVLNDKSIKQYVDALNKLSIQHSVESSPESAPNGNAIGEIVRIRGLSNAANADALAQELKQNKLNFSTRFSAQDGYSTNGPFEISVLRIDLNQYQGKVKSVLANDVITTAETVSSMATRNNALAAINGGFFAFNDEVGDFGAPAGLYVKDGKILREAANDRPVLIIDNSGAHSKVTIASSVTTDIFLNHNNKSLRLDGLNRKPGTILNCGGYGDTPSTEAIHDFVCTDDSEIIVYGSAYGAKSPVGEGREIIIDDAGKVVKVNNVRGSQIDLNHQYIQLTGDAQLTVKIGDMIAINSKVMVDGKEFALTSGLSMVNAGPSLVTNFEIDKESRNSQGFNPYPSTGDHAGSQDDDGLGVSGVMENREGFYNGWALRRHPRTALGVTADNVVYATVVYGRQPTVTEGASITDMALMMKSLGAKNAINLDGGGSSMMVINGKRTGASSDDSEREVSDAIVFTH